MSWFDIEKVVNIISRLTKNEDIPSDEVAPCVSKYSLSRAKLSLIAWMLSIPKKTIW